ncbi:MAG: hypothetical protein HFJ75_08145 [Eggerthellaceae bacterium]|nr:hypothetical protein [Eggerthellaceae bacterium]
MKRSVLVFALLGVLMLAGCVAEGRETPDAAGGAGPVQLGEWVSLVGLDRDEAAGASAPSTYFWEGELRACVRGVASVESPEDVGIPADSPAILRDPDGPDARFLVCAVEVSNVSAHPWTITQTERAAFNISSLVALDGVGDYAYFGGTDPAMSPEWGEGLYFTLAPGQDALFTIGFYLPVDEGHRPVALKIGDQALFDLVSVYEQGSVGRLD